jgi:hypothetical protein
MGIFCNSNCKRLPVSNLPSHSQPDNPNKKNVTAPSPFFSFLSEKQPGNVPIVWAMNCTFSCNYSPQFLLIPSLCLDFLIPWAILQAILLIPSLFPAYSQLISANSKFWAILKTILLIPY